VRKWQAVVFDLDDVLYPERDYVLSGFAAVAQWAEVRLNISATEGIGELTEFFDRGVRGNTFNRWLTARGISDDGIVGEMIRVYRDHEPTLTAFPEIPRLLKDLRKSCRLGLLSDGYLGVQQRKISALGLSSYFNSIILTDSLGRQFWKPSEVPFNEAMRRLNSPARKAVYIGDNPLKDFFGARQIGMYTIWLRRESGEYVTFEAPTDRHAPHLVVNSFADLRDALLHVNEARELFFDGAR
jgi:putative hydrolase of the HAD superfamily